MTTNDTITRDEALFAVHPDGDLDGLEPDYLEIVADSFDSPSEDTVHRAMRQLYAMTRRAEALKAAAARDHALVDEWLTRQLGRLPEAITNVEVAIERMALALLAATGTKSISTPWGTAQTRTTRAWEWTDDLALKWAIESGLGGMFVVTPPPPGPRIDKTELKRAVDVLDDGRVAYRGEVLDFVVAPERTTVTVTTHTANTNTNREQS